MIQCLVLGYDDGYHVLHKFSVLMPTLRGRLAQHEFALDVRCLYFHKCLFVCLFVFVIRALFIFPSRSINQGGHNVSKDSLMT